MLILPAAMPSEFWACLKLRERLVEEGGNVLQIICALRCKVWEHRVGEAGGSKVKNKLAGRIVSNRASGFIESSPAALRNEPVRER